jgi:uncharacterized protein (TIGR03435 family)
LALHALWRIVLEIAMRFFSWLCLSCFALSLLALPGRAQSPTEFEAASLHRLSPGATPNFSGADILDASVPEGRKAPSLLSTDAGLFELLVSAYDIANAGLHPALMKQLPAWAGPAVFHLSARVPDGATVGDMRRMLQTLLRERLALAIHEETRSIPVLLLQVDSKQKKHLIPFRGVCDASLSASSPDACGEHFRYAEGMAQVTFHGETLAQMANHLSGYAYYMGGLKSGPVVNDTGIEGRFDASFTFLPLMKADVAGGPGFVDALRQDLGLVLHKGERPMKLLLVDHVEQPTEN